MLAGGDAHGRAAPPGRRSRWPHGIALAAPFGARRRLAGGRVRSRRGSRGERARPQRGERRQRARVRARERDRQSGDEGCHVFQRRRGERGTAGDPPLGRDGRSPGGDLVSGTAYFTASEPMLVAYFGFLRHGGGHDSRTLDQRAAIEQRLRGNCGRGHGFIDAARTDPAGVAEADRFQLGRRGGGDRDPRDGREHRKLAGGHGHGVRVTLRQAAPRPRRLQRQPGRHGDRHVQPLGGADRDQGADGHDSDRQPRSAGGRCRGQGARALGAGRGRDIFNGSPRQLRGPRSCRRPLVRY